MTALVGIVAFIVVILLVAAVVLLIREALERRERNKPDPEWEVFWTVIRRGGPTYGTPNAYIGETIVCAKLGDEVQVLDRLRQGHDPVEFDVALERAQEVVKKRNEN